MYKGILCLALLLCTYMLPAAVPAQQLLGLDKSVRLDSINHWFKFHIRKLDSASAFAAINELEQAATRGGNDIGTALIPYLKGQYCDVKLKKYREAEQYYRQAINLAKEKRLDYEWTVFMFQLGIFYYFTDNIPASIENLLRAHDKLKEIGYERDRYAAWHLYHIAYIYYHLHNYSECLGYLALADRYFTDTSDRWLAMQMPNTRGLAYTYLGRYNEAFTSFDKALKLAMGYNDSTWIGIVMGNKGEVYLKTGKLDSALLCLQTNYDYITIRRLNGTPGTTVRVLTAMADVYVHKRQANKALALLSEALQKWPQTEADDYWRQAYMFETMGKAYALKNDFVHAYRYQQMGQDVRDSITRRDDALRYIYVQQQLDAEKQQAFVKLVQSREKAISQRRRFVFTGILLLGVIGWLAYNRYRLRMKKDLELREKQNELLNSERLRMHADLEHSKNLLDQYVASVKEKNQLIENFKDELIRVEQKVYIETDREEQAEYIQQLSDATLLTDDEWNRFRTLFEKVHRGFFAHIKDKIPDLTEAEIRLIALVKLNIPNKQIAHMLGISPASVHTARYRLRKKIALKDESQLEDLKL